MQMFVQDKQRRVIVLNGNGVDLGALDDELGEMIRRKASIVDVANPLWWGLFANLLPRRDVYDRQALVYRDELDEDGTSDTTQIYSDLYGGTLAPSHVPSELV